MASDTREPETIEVDGDTVVTETGEVVERPEMVRRGSLIKVEPRPLSEFIPMLASDEEIEQGKQLMAAYDRACAALVGPNDVQEEGGRTFKKKSAWRKLGRHFRISTEIVKVESWWEWDEEDGVRHFKARVIARGTAPWGQVMEAVGGCATREPRFWTQGPACPSCGGGMWDNRKSSRSDDDFNCRRKACGTRLYPGKYDPEQVGVGRQIPNATAFAKAEHDCEATAATRATNRVISDLIAAGEVSAEEVDGAGDWEGAPDYQDEPEPKPEKKKPATEEDANAEQVATIRGLMDAAGLPEKLKYEKEVRLKEGITRKQAAAAISSLEALIAAKEAGEGDGFSFTDKEKAVPKKDELRQDIVGLVEDMAWHWEKVERLTDEALSQEHDPKAWKGQSWADVFMALPLEDCEEIHAYIVQQAAKESEDA